MSYRLFSFCVHIIVQVYIILGMTRAAYFFLQFLIATELVVVHLFCVVHEFFVNDDDEHCVHWKFSVFVATDYIPGLNG